MRSACKILVTGANHIIGKSLIESLVSQGKSVRAIANKKVNFKENPLVEFIKISLLDITAMDSALKGIEQVYHCDEFLSYLPRDEEKMYNINVLGTENLVNLALSNHIKKIVYISSTFSFGTYQHPKKISERTNRIEHKENTYYCICKSRAELEILRGKAEGLITNIICPSIVLVKTPQAHSYNFVSFATKNHNNYPKGSNGFIGINDLIQIITKIMESNITEEKIIASAANHSYKAVMDMINLKFKSNKKWSPRRIGLYRLIAKTNATRNILFGSRPFLTPELLKLHQKNFEIDNSKVKELLNYKFTPIELVVSAL